MKDVAQDGSEDVFPQTGDQKNHIVHLHNFTAHQEDDAKRDVPEEERREAGGSEPRSPQLHPNASPRPLTT